MTTPTPPEQLATWLRSRSPGAMLPEPPEGLEDEVVEAVLALRPDLAPAPRVRVEDILQGVEAGPFWGSETSPVEEEPTERLPEEDPTDLPVLGAPGLEKKAQEDLEAVEAGPFWGSLKPPRAVSPRMEGADQAAEDPTNLPAAPMALRPSELPDVGAPASEDTNSPAAFDAEAFNAGLESYGATAEVDHLDTESAQALTDWMDKRSSSAEPEGVSDDVVEAVYALRPDLAPAPRFDLDDVLDGVTEGPFAQGGAEVVPLHGRPAAAAAPTPEASPGVVDLASERRRRMPWWALPGAGVLAAAAMATVVVLPALLMNGAPEAEEAAAVAMDAGPRPTMEAETRPSSSSGGSPHLAKKSAPTGIIATGTPSAGEKLDATFGAKAKEAQEYKAAEGGGSVGGLIDGSIDAPAEQQAAAPALQALGYLDDAAGAELSRDLAPPPEPGSPVAGSDAFGAGRGDLASKSAGPTTSTASTTVPAGARPTDEAAKSRATKGQDMEPPAPGRASAPAADPDMDIADLSQSVGRTRSTADKQEERSASRRQEADRAKDLADSLRGGGGAEAPAASAMPAREELAVEDDELEELDVLGNTGATYNTGGEDFRWDRNTGDVDLGDDEAEPEAPQDIASLRLEAAPGSVSPSRTALRSLYAEVAAADDVASQFLTQGDTASAIRALEVLLSFSDPNVALDTAYEVANLQRQVGRADLALRTVQTGLLRSGGSASQRGRLLSLRGQLLEAQGDIDSARRSYEEAVRSY